MQQERVKRGILICVKRLEGCRKYLGVLESSMVSEGPLVASMASTASADGIALLVLHLDQAEWREEIASVPSCPSRENNRYSAPSLWTPARKAGCGCGTDGYGRGGSKWRRCIRERSRPSFAQTDSSLSQLRPSQTSADFPPSFRFPAPLPFFFAAMPAEACVLVSMGEELRP